ncbi:MAG: hypothetical protein M1817_001267 [Caeruleum heppii]|nr:MAG: hypothetical protein M1817_001267 [Caeruleum heppii]
MPERRLQNAALLICDIQEKFRGAIWEYDKVTTQSAAKLGPLCSELSLASAQTAQPTIDKTAFSMCVPELTAQLPSTSETPSAIIILGIESHICVTQTALDLRRRGHDVYVLADGVSSCNPQEVPLALARLRAEGVVVTSSEGVLYEIMGDAGIAE